MSNDTDQIEESAGPSVRRKRWLAVPVAGLALAGAAAVFGGSAAYADAPAHGGSSADALPPVVANAGNAVKVVTDHLQYEHIDQPLLGFGPALEDPTGWLTGHVVPLVVEVVD